MIFSSTYMARFYILIAFTQCYIVRAFLECCNLHNQYLMGEWLRQEWGFPFKVRKVFCKQGWWLYNTETVLNATEPYRQSSLPRSPSKSAEELGFALGSVTSLPNSSLPYSQAPTVASNFPRLCSCILFIFLNIFLALSSHKLYRHI